MKDEELDRVLDEGLASYSRREPRAGLEARVLAHVWAEGRRRRIPRWVFAVPALAAAAVMLAIVFRPAPKPAPMPIAEVKQAVAPAAESPAVERRKPRRVRAARRMLPKRQIFPTPVPLTPEERALLAFIRRSPEQARQLFAPPTEPGIEPIRIEEIRIEPLQMDGPEQEN